MNSRESADHLPYLHAFKLHPLNTTCSCVPPRVSAATKAHVDEHVPGADDRNDHEDPSITEQYVDEHVLKAESNGDESNVDGIAAQEDHDEHMPAASFFNLGRPARTHATGQQHSDSGL